ncbi:MAG: sulfotransferase [Glaciecola sp.]|jgi:hypothetical protein
MTLPTNTNIIFVAGFPRSGTTWFSNLINSHPNVVYRHEIIGRNYKMFGDELFSKLKYDFGLCDTDFDKAMQVICNANVVTDKPPFFKKKIGLSRFPHFHHIMWVVSKVIRLLSPIYSTLFSVSERDPNIQVLIKETRSTDDMSSILKGLRVNKAVFLVRKPQGSIASFVKGIKENKMGALTPEGVLKWFDNQGHNEYVRKLAFSNDKIRGLSPVEFFAISWRVYHMDLLQISQELENAMFCIYEDFVAEPEVNTKMLFDKLDMSYSDSVKMFIEESSGKVSKSPLIKDSNSDFYSVYRSTAFNVESWKEQLSSDEIELIDFHTLDIYKSIEKVKFS